MSALFALWPEVGAVVTAPPAAASGATPLLPTDPRLVVTVSGLAQAACVTLLLRVRSVNPVRQYSMLASILASDGGYTDLSYSPLGGLAQNTYGPGFWKEVGNALADGQEHVVSVKLYQQQQGSRFALYVDGVQLALLDDSDPATGKQNGQVERDFTDTFVLGDTDGVRFEGLISAWQLHLADLSDAARLAAEASL